MTKYAHAAWNGKSYLVRHGDPFDRGQSDFYYGAPRDPHYHIGSVASTPRIGIEGMTDEQIDTYHAGCSCARDIGDQKDWG